MTAAAAAQVFIVLVGVVVAFQVTLAGGMPWGHLTWGGKFAGRLPGYMRAVALLSAVLLLVFALVVGVRAGFLFPEWQLRSQPVMWGIVTYSALGVLANTLTPSRWERIVWLPVTLAMLVCSIIVAVS